MARNRRASALGSRKPAKRRGGASGRGRGAQAGLSVPLALGAVAAIAVMAGLFFYQGRVASAMSIDPETLCPTSGPVAMQAILIDVTDSMGAAQVAKLHQLIDKQIADAPVGTQFSVGMVSDDPSQLGARIKLCKPHSGDDVSQVSQNVRLVETRYRERFLTPVQAMIDQLLENSTATSSPIMEALQLLVAQTPGFITYEGPKQVFIASDLLQHSDAMSFYRAEGWDSFTASGQASRLSRSLDGVDVSLLVIPRPTSWSGDTAQLENFWVRYFDAQGAHAPKLLTLGDL